MAAGVKIKRKYEALRKKHKLPKFEELDFDFEISKIEPGAFLLREIRRKVAEKVQDAGCIIEEALQPDTNLASLYESRVLDEAEKKQIFELYKKLMATNRLTLELSIKNNDKEDAEFITAFHSEWKKLAPELLRFLKKLKESWEKESEEDEKLRYMG